MQGILRTERNYRKGPILCSDIKCMEASHIMDAAQLSDMEPDAITGRGHIAREGGPKLPWTS